MLPAKSAAPSESPSSATSSPATSPTPCRHPFKNTPTPLPRHSAPRNSSEQAHEQRQPDDAHPNDQRSARAACAVPKSRICSDLVFCAISGLLFGTRLIKPGRSCWHLIRVAGSHDRMPEAWEVRNCRQVGEARRGAGQSPAAARIRWMVLSPTRRPRPRSSPWIRRVPTADSLWPAARLDPGSHRRSAGVPPCSGRSSAS